MWTAAHIVPRHADTVVNGMHCAVDASDKPLTTEEINTAVHLSRADSSGAAVTASQTFSLTMTNVLPLVLRAFSKASAVTGTPNATE